MRTADCVEGLMNAYGDTNSDEKRRLCNSMLDDLLPPYYWELSAVQFSDGSMWIVWTW